MAFQVNLPLLALGFTDITWNTQLSPPVLDSSSSDIPTNQGLTSAAQTLPVQDPKILTCISCLKLLEPHPTDPLHTPESDPELTDLLDGYSFV